MALTQVAGGLIASGQTITSPTLSSPTINGTPVMGASVITSGTAVASTSGTSINFTSIPSWVKRITVMFSDVSTNGASLIQTQLGTSGGVQITGYVSAGWMANTLNNSSTTGLLVVGQGNAAYTYRGIATFALLNSATGLWVSSSAMDGGSSGTSTFATGSKTLSGTLDRVRITTVNGTDTFDAGSINILYE
jgi:hypothetical protein